MRYTRTYDRAYYDISTRNMLTFITNDNFSIRNIGELLFYSLSESLYMCKTVSCGATVLNVFLVNRECDSLP